VPLRIDQTIDPPRRRHRNATRELHFSIAFGRLEQFSSPFAATAAMASRHLPNDRQSLQNPSSL
jgi:hypothetical protein